VQNKVELHGVVYQGYFPSIRVLNAASASARRAGEPVASRLAA